MVQFVTAPDAGAACALKFFAGRAAFEDARQRYLHGAVGRFMPTVLAFVPNEDGGFCDPFDNPMPPCIVMEAGEPLPERAALCNGDAAALAQVRRRHDALSRTQLHFHMTYWYYTQFFAHDVGVAGPATSRTG